MDNKKKKLRWRYFIDKPFQLRFIARFTLLILIGLALSFAVIGILNLQKFDKPIFYQTKKVSDIVIPDTVKDQDAVFSYTIDRSRPLNSFQLYWPPLVLVSALYLILIAIFGLFISHKMAGPVYRIKKTLDEASNGKIDLKTLEFRLRKKDELQDLVDAMNNFLDKTYHK